MWRIFSIFWGKRTASGEEIIYHDNVCLLSGGVLSCLPFSSRLVFLPLFFGLLFNSLSLAPCQNKTVPFCMTVISSVYKDDNVIKCHTSRADPPSVDNMNIYHTSQITRCFSSAPLRSLLSLSCLRYRFFSTFSVFGQNVHVHAETSRRRFANRRITIYLYLYQSTHTQNNNNNNTT